MSVWSEVKREAARWHAKLTSDSKALTAADKLLEAAQQETGIKVLTRPSGDALLRGAEAVYDPQAHRIYYSSATDPGLAYFHIAHEFAHHWLDQYANQCGGADIDIATAGEPEMSWVGDPDAYSPKERAEALANVFAREFLLPREWLRAACAKAPFEANHIASTVKVPIELVMQQLADALLLPDVPQALEESEPEHEPDETQQLAIEAPGEPLRVIAGPGTGKTRTLIGRVAHLLDSGVDPHSIAILTFSNLSAQDLSARLRKAVGENATALWAGTFHAFGLELLRKYGHAIGLGTDMRLIDRSASLDLLLELLPSLNLKHFLDLNEPLRKLGAVANLISRAKDELATPDQYARAARAQEKAATAADAAAVEQAKQSLEVAQAYALYDRTLRERGWVDFGDLIARSVELLRSHPDIATQVHSQYAHILVDEYQDMNRASGLFLAALVKAGQGPWVVGDVRQAIYRFRGASPLNLERFDRDFAGAKSRELLGNYRSGGKIIRTFETFGGGSPLIAHRGEAHGIVDLKVATTAKAEFEGISKAIKTHVAQGGLFRHHAVLARSHTTLARLALHLEVSGVPCLYFGDFFERPEIRNLLSLLQLASEHTGVGLVRVAQFPQYQVSDADLTVLFGWQAQQDEPMLHVLRHIEAVPGLSVLGREVLRRLAEDLWDVNFAQRPHTFLMNFLFRRGHHLAPLLADSSVASQQQRLAIFQLLQFCFAFRTAADTDPKRMFLDHVRRLELLDEEKQLRGLPAAVAGIDAVRLMTVHASKGLQFPIVHILALTSRHFPLNRKETYTLPPGLCDTSALMSREAEEDALFFVALSRARDELKLSRAIDNAGGIYRKCPPSPFLERIRYHLPIPPDASPQWSKEGIAVEISGNLPAPEPRTSWAALAIETYLECPRKFYYGEVLKLRPNESRSPFLKTNTALRSSIDWLRNTNTAKERTSGLMNQFKADWASKGPKGPLESLYRRAAEQMIETAAAVMDGESLPLDLSLSLSGGITITARPDHLSLRNGKIRILRLKQGRLAKKETAKARYAIWQAAARQQHHGASIQFEHVSLMTADRSDAEADEKALRAQLTKIEGSLQDIAAGRFAPVTNVYCPQCPFYFICPNHFRIVGGSG